MNDADVSMMCERLGLPDAPLVTSGVRTTLEFFRDVLRTDPFQWCDYIRGIDFHKPVHRQHLAPGTSLSRHKSTGPSRRKPFVYFTKPGTSQFRTGTSFPESVYELFEVTSSVAALVSSTSGIKFHPTDRVSRLGGGVQYILSARDSEHLRRR